MTKIVAKDKIASFDQEAASVGENGDVDVSDAGC